MRTNVVIDDKLMKQAMKLSGLKTKKAVIEESLNQFIQLLGQRNIATLFGKLKWEGDLDAMRRDS